MQSTSCRGTAILALLVVSLSGCGPDRKSQAISKCQTDHTAQDDGLVLLFGTEGVQELCACAIATVYDKLPDADQQVAIWLRDVGDKVGRRGLLGAARDSTWVTGRSTELVSFATVYFGAWLTCAEKVTAPPSAP